MEISLNKNIIGHKAQREFLLSQVIDNRLPHSVIMSGPSSIGKFLTALELALNFLKNNFKLLNSSSSVIDCEQISSMISSLTYPDLYILRPEEGKKVISTDQARALIERLSLNSYYNIGAIIIIDGAESLSTSAANCLLKSLEEPESNRLFITITNNIQSILPTIRSRSQNISYGKLSEKEIEQILLSRTDLSPDIIKSYTNIMTVDGTLKLLIDSIDQKNTDIFSKIEIDQNILINKVKKIQSFSGQVRDALKNAIINKNISEVINIFTVIEKDENEEINKSTSIDLVINETRKLALESTNQEAKNFAWLSLDKLILAKKEIQNRNLNISLSGPKSYI